MLKSKPIPDGRECGHITCSNTCHRDKPGAKIRKPIKRTSPVKRYSSKPVRNKSKNINPEEKEYNEKLKCFFKKMMEINDPICSNCGSYLPHLKAPYYEFLWKSCQSHLLEKRNFKSIATNPLNIMVMGSGISGMCWCHDNYGSSWMKASQMSIWGEVVRRFRILYPIIALEEHRFIPEILLNTLHDDK